MAPALSLLLPLSMAPSPVPFFFISLNSTTTGAQRTAKMLATFSSVTTHLEHVPAVDGNASARDYTHADAQYNHLLKRNSMSEVASRSTNSRPLLTQASRAHTHI